MKLTILKVILWPKDTNHVARVIPFVAGKVNVITGDSATGKSSLTWIIDYALGSDKCSIPVGLIREVTDWFGLHIKLANTELIIARRNPEDQQSTNEFYWEEGLDLAVPAIVTRNARIEDLKNRFNQVALLPSLDFSGDENVGFGGRPSFRDMAAFNFQPQHIVANPYTFFFKADTTKHREKLRIIFPFVLGAIDAETLATQRKLKDLQRERDRLQKELDARLAAAKAWETEVESYFLQAQSLGLLPDSPTPDSAWSLDKYILELRKVPESVKNLDIPDVREGTGEQAAQQLTNLVTEEDGWAQQAGSLRRRLNKLEQLNQSVSEYRVTLTGQEDRLLGTGWLKQKLSSEFSCPVCAAVHPDGNPRLNELVELATELKGLTSSVYQAPAKLDLELADVREELREKERGLAKARQKRKSLEDQSAGQARQRLRVRQIYLFVGRIEQALSNISNSKNVGDVAERVKALNAEIRDLARILDPANQKDRLEAAIKSASGFIATHARTLRLEHSEENVQLNISELTLQFNPLSGKTDFLWEVGSGQNWVGYHIAGILGLHEHFKRVKNNSVPQFLVIDQPSQVYFPEAWSSIDQAPLQDDSDKQSTDIEGVRRIFGLLSYFLKKIHPDFQIIVTEHAGAITWKGLDNIHLVGNWREGQDEFLIPKAWILSRDKYAD